MNWWIWFYFQQGKTEKVKMQTSPLFRCSLSWANSCMVSSIQWRVEYLDCRRTTETTRFPSDDSLSNCRLHCCSLVVYNCKIYVSLVQLLVCAAFLNTAFVESASSVILNTMFLLHFFECIASTCKETSIVPANLWSRLSGKKLIN